jgi:hypothetical protein
MTKCISALPSGPPGSRPTDELDFAEIAPRRSLRGAYRRRRSLAKSGCRAETGAIRRWTYSRLDVAARLGQNIKLVEAAVINSRDRHMYRTGGCGARLPCGRRQGSESQVASLPKL